MTTIDLTYRPDYWPDAPTTDQLVSSIRGQARRNLVARDPSLREMGGEWLAAATLTPEERSWWGALHPTNMGGEYLPDFDPEEVEIARVSLASTTADQISIRAAWDAGRIRYSVDDEYGTTFVCAITESERPLTMGEVIRLIDGTCYEDDGWHLGLVKYFWRWYAEAEGPNSQPTAFTSVSSAYYPDLGAFYEEEAERWLASYCEENVGDDV